MPTPHGKPRVDSLLSTVLPPSPRSEFTPALSQLTLPDTVVCSQYYGRSEEDQESMEESIMSANGLGGLESSAREAVRTIMEQTGIEDVEGLQSAIRQGALKVRSLALTMLDLDSNDLLSVHS